jgi:hypothetical protein
MRPRQWWSHTKRLRAERYADRPWIAPWLTRYGATYSRRPVAVLAEKRRIWILPNGDYLFGGRFTEEDVREAERAAAGRDGGAPEGG